MFQEDGASGKRLFPLALGNLYKEYIMKSSRIVVAGILLAGFWGLAFSPRPDVKTTSTTKMTFKGAMGTLMKMAGGNKPATGTQYIKGNKSRSDNFDDEGKLTTSSIIDLDREIIVNVDHKKKEFTEMTFAELRDMLKKLGAQAQEPAPTPSSSQKPPEVKVSFDVKVDRTGEKKNLLGYNTEKVVLTLTAQGEGQSESGETGKGGLVVTSTYWLAGDIKGYDELKAFQKMFAERLGAAFDANSMAVALQNMMKSNPQLSEGMKKLAEEAKKLGGVPVSTTSVFETWAESSGEKNVAQETQSSEQEKPKSVGGLLGGLGKKLGQKAVKKDESANNSGRSVLLESTSEISEISTAPVDAGLFNPPAGYEKKVMPKN
jgi:hypothetical protein